MTSVKQVSRTRPGWRAIVVLTLGMGIAVAVAWFAIGLPFGFVDSFGLDLESVARPRRLAIYALQGALVAGFGFVLGKRWLDGLSLRALAASFALVWLLEGVWLTVFGTLVANEIDPESGWYYWLVATAGPLQPAVGFAGAWLGQRAAASASRRS